MAIAHATVALTTTAALISSGSDDDTIPGTSIYFENETGVDIRIGGPGITTSGGGRLAPGDSFSWDLNPGDRLYAVCASGSHNQPVVYGGV